MSDWAYQICYPIFVVVLVDFFNVYIQFVQIIQYDMCVLNFLMYRLEYSQTMSLVLKKLTKLCTVFL